MIVNTAGGVSHILTVPAFGSTDVQVIFAVFLQPDTTNALTSGTGYTVGASAAGTANVFDFTGLTAGSCYLITDTGAGSVTSVTICTSMLYMFC